MMVIMKIDRESSCALVMRYIRRNVRIIKVSLINTNPLIGVCLDS
jgi:hypothetical protein